MKGMIQVLVVVTVGLMVGLSTAAAQPPESCGKMDGHMMAPPDQMDGHMMAPPDQVADNVLKELNLTAEQKGKLKQNRRAQRDKMEDLQAELREKQVELMNKLDSPDVSRADVEPIAAELTSLHAKMISCRLDGIFAVKEILMPEQYAKFQEKVKEKVQDRKEFRKEQRKEWREKKGR